MTQSDTCRLVSALSDMTSMISLTARHAERGLARMGFRSDATEVPPELYKEKFDPEKHVYETYLLNMTEYREAVMCNQAAIRACDLCVLLLPCGNDSHADWGVAVGANKLTYVVSHPLAGERTPSHLWADKFYDNVGQFLVSMQHQSQK